MEICRPIANLCSFSKVFEKLIHKIILQILKANNCDITGTNKYGFKQGTSKSTLEIKLQSMIVRAIDENNYVLAFSLCLSAAFVVCVPLLLKRLRIVCLPTDVLGFIKLWLTNRSHYVRIDGRNSVLFNLLLGTVQSLEVGPIMKAIVVFKASMAQSCLKSNNKCKQIFQPIK
jgi:hypothetical protein